MKSGPVLISEFKKIQQVNDFKLMKEFSDSFLESNKKILRKYSLFWVKNPLQQWSRIYEYPYVLEKIKKYSKSKSIKILDAGSGITFFPFFLKNIFPSSTVVCCDNDKSLKIIYQKVSKKQKNKIDFYNQNISKLNFRNNEFDVIYCISVLEHTANYAEILKEFERILKPNGILIITYDISLDGFRDIPIKEAINLEEELKSKFRNLEKSSEIDKLIIHNNLYTTQYVWKANKKSLPSKFPLLNVAKYLLKCKSPKLYFPLACSCQIYKVKNNNN